MESNGIVVKTDGRLNLDQIAGSGQCFRWNKFSDNSYQIIAFNKVLAVSQLKRDVLKFNCSNKEFKNVWRDYFDLDTDYKMITIDPKDIFLKKAFEFGKGIRILKQDPWEVLITFIISQQKNIPSIKKTVETMSMCFGSPIDAKRKLYAFPSPNELSAAKEEDYYRCKLGYRLKYVRDTAREFSSGRITMDQLASYDDEKLFNQLLKLHGVGPKIANCVMLFGFNRLNAFPRDVWINRALEKEYPDGFDSSRYSPFNGVIQQYIFNFYRNKVGK